ncbi:hypothetical protein B0H19DRAFT_903606, partial [Mycena capillaripes]
REEKSRWCTAAEQMHKIIEKSTTSAEAAGRAKAALQALERIPWDGKVEGFKAGGAFEDLALWLTTDWLKTDNEDQMLELLAADLGLSDGSTSAIETTYFVIALAQAYSNPDAYRTSSRFGWLRRLGTSFATKDRKRLGTIGNIADNHWITLIVDCEKGIIGYGDGFGSKAPASLRKHLDWWLFEHLATEYRWTDIPVPKQLDGHSCGIMAYFALAYWFDKKRFPLPTSTAASMADERIKMFLRIVERHERKKSDFSSDARDYEFTF